MNDLHKPALDAIGFQDLITSKMAWWDNFIDTSGVANIKKFSAGKQPAWIDYMSNYNRTHGNFDTNAWYGKHRKQYYQRQELKVILLDKLWKKHPNHSLIKS